MQGFHLVAALLASSAILGCAAVPSAQPMAPDRPVVIGSGGQRYRQDGEAIDVSDMQDQLAKEPEAEGYVSGAKATKILGVLLAGAGGAMIGTPLGLKAGGNPHPPWALAGAGAGVVAGGLALAVASPFILDKAVKAHNKRFEKPAARLFEPPPDAATPVPPGPRRDARVLALEPSAAAAR